jgi:hypothetical protein
MGQKNLGPSVSGYFDPDGRSFETVVFEAGKPVLDKELQLSQDIDSGYALGASRNATPSGWLTTSHVDSSDSITTLFSGSFTDNTLTLANNLKALVNGWPVLVAHTGNTGSNLLSLGSGPSGNGAKRTDLVVLEVWRRLIAPTPATDGKSPTNRIWRNGNVKIASADDTTLNYVEDFIDPIVGSETTQRVQIQYRLRVVTGVDIFSYPYGIDDPIVVARSTPVTAGTPDGVVTTFVYNSQSASGDQGLWVAGDGDPANTLNTVDGYMYAIPLCAVFRRNTTAFSKNLNHNGGVATPGPSDRPDGLFYDILVADDLADLRQAVSPTGWNYAELAQKCSGLLLDNRVKTEWVTTPIGGGVSGHTVLWADEFGTLPGDGVLTGDTPGAEFRGQFDCTRRFFSDRANYEVMTYRITPGDPNISTSSWATGTVITIDLSAVSQYPFPGTIGFLSRAPSGTKVIDVIRARVEGTTAPELGADVGQSSIGSALEVPVPIASITGIGEYPPGIITITLGTIPGSLSGLSVESLYVDLLVAYPPGQGLTKTPVADFALASFSINNPGVLAALAAAPYSYAAITNQALNYTNREAQLQYNTSDIVFTLSAETTTTVSDYYLPERALSLTGVTVNAVPRAATLDASGRKIHLVSMTNPGDVVVVTYVALRPMPQVYTLSPTTPQITIFYKARAPQTIRDNLLGTTLTLVPRWISDRVYSISTGSGSQGEGYPYPYAYVQAGGIIKSVGTFGGEFELDGSPDVYVADFNASTGFLNIPVYIPYVPSADEVTLNRSLADADIEDRTFFSQFPAGYVPNAFAPPLSDPRTHKVVLPSLMETTADTSLGKKGTLLLVNFIRWAELDAENSVEVLPPLNNTTVASIFRLPGNPLNRRAQ